MSRRRPVPLPVPLAVAFARYVAAAVEAGVSDAECWTLARRTDGTVWLHLCTGPGAPAGVRFASSVDAAVRLLGAA